MQWTMWLRGTLSALCLVLFGGAVVLWDCTTIVINLVSGETPALCTTVEGFGIGETGWVAAGLAVFTLATVALIWIPVVRAHRRQSKAQPERALIQNIGRLTDPYQDWDSGLTKEMSGELIRRVEVIETAFGADGSADRDLTTEWIWLLTESNRRHNSGEMTTEEFKEVNTRLLDVVSPSSPSRTGAAPS